MLQLRLGLECRSVVAACTPHGSDGNENRGCHVEMEDMVVRCSTLALTIVTNHRQARMVTTTMGE
jgi:hypothetical protein